MCISTPAPTHRHVAAAFPKGPYACCSSTCGSRAAEPLAGAELGCKRQSVALLQAQCQALMGRMPTTAVEDEATLAAAEVQQLGPRLRQAVATRFESMQLLLAAVCALQQYAETLR